MEEKKENNKKDFEWKNKNFLAGIIFVLLIINCATAYALFAEHASLIREENTVASEETNIKIVAFTKLLIEKVLESPTAIDFGTRAELENAAEAIGDPAVLDQWNAFVNSADNSDAQIQIKNLLDLLISKITLIN